MEIDAHTLAEANELIEGWNENPPVHLLVKALVIGFGGQTASHSRESSINDSNIDEIRAKAGAMLPVYRGRDPGLPSSAPIFDLNAMREKNAMKILARNAARAESKGRMTRG